MPYRGREIPVTDLTGGQASNRAITGLELNQALEVDNVHSLPGGGIRLRQGDVEVNSAAFASGAAWTGLLWYQKSNGDTDLVGVAGTLVGKIDYSGGSPDGTVDNVTGSLTITGGANNLWTSFTAGDEAIFVGGAPDVPFVFDGTSTSIVSGSAPSGDFGFFHNNRMFIGTKATSFLQNSTLANIKDFSGDGSGTVDVDGKDGDGLITAVPLNTDVILAFKQNSIHQIITTSFPFRRFPLFKNIGCIGKHAKVIHEGLIYFITPQGRMKATDGSSIKDFPTDMDDVWDEISKTRLPFIIGYFEQGKNFRHIKWTVSADGGSTNSLSIIWDLDKKSWWKFTTGHNVNTVTTDRDANIIYAGHYDGKIYEKNKSGIFTDASESDTGIDGLWRWGWQTNNSLQISIHPQRLNTSMEGQTSGELRVTYGFDFANDIKTEDIDMSVAGALWDTDLWDEGIWAGQTDIIRNILLFGRGNAFSIAFKNKTAGEVFQVNYFTVSGKESAQKIFQAI